MSHNMRRCKHKKNVPLNARRCCIIFNQRSIDADFLLLWIWFFAVRHRHCTSYFHLFYQHITKFSMLKSRTNWRSLVFCLSLAILAVTAIAQRFALIFIISLVRLFIVVYMPICKRTGLSIFRWDTNVSKQSNDCCDTQTIFGFMRISKLMCSSLVPFFNSVISNFSLVWFCFWLNFHGLSFRWNLVVR